MNTDSYNISNEVEQLKKISELKTAWISLLSHDFKEAFSSLLWTLEAYDSGAIGKDDFFKLLPRIKQDAKKNLQTINDTNDWVKTQLDGYKPNVSKIFVVDLYIKLRKEFEDKLNNKRLDFKFSGDETIICYNDEFLICFILKKFLDNAIKYSNTNKTILFEVERRDEMLTLKIVDEGIGMSKETKDNLFSLDSAVFQGTDSEIGAGLSLKIVKYFVSLLQGKIDIKSTENKGSTFQVSLPCKEN